MVKKMTNKKEHLSSVFDDEATEFEQRRFLDELDKDDELKQSWSNYALIGDVLREPSQTQSADPDFLINIQHRLEEEEQFSDVKAMFKDEKAEQSNWTRPLAGFAMAATVAAVSVFGTQTYMTANTASDSQIASTPQIQTIVPSSATPPIATTAKKTSNADTTLATNTQDSKMNTKSLNVATTAKDTIAKRDVIDADSRIMMRRYLATHIENASRRTIAPTMREISYNY